MAQGSPAHLTAEAMHKEAARASQVQAAGCVTQADGVRGRGQSWHERVSEGQERHASDVVCLHGVSCTSCV